MKKFTDFEFSERKEIVSLFSNWLNIYTDEVVKKVMKKADEIINNDFVMNLLTELKDREESERGLFEESICVLFTDFEEFEDHNTHNDFLSHAQSYRDVLYDMYIRG